MAAFRDTEHLYEVLGALFQRISDNEPLAASLAAGGFVLRFRYREPDGQLTIDLRQTPIRWEFGEGELKPDLEMIQSGDTANEFFLGQLNVARAIATRRVVARGPIAKALKLLPAIKPAYPMYQQLLRDLGYEDMIPAAAGTGNGASARWRGAVADARQWLSGLRSALSKPQFDRAAVNAHCIPLVEEPTVREVQYRDQGLPSDGTELRIEMLRRMHLIRAFELKLSEAYAGGEVPTEAIHLSIGQEATAVGVCFALRADDYVATTHRGHGHMLAKGADLDGMSTELLAKAAGLCGGKGGSMHVTDAAVGAVGANGIVCAGPLIVAGAAQSAVQRGTDQVAVAFVGDGATNQGMFHEALNYAAVFDLPVIIVVENNLYGEFTPVAKHTRVTQLSDRAAAYGIPGVTVDGNDVWAVYEATQHAAARARRGEGPVLLECNTYRWHGHMEGDAAPYRSKKELASWKKRCPIAACERVLVDDAGVDRKRVKKLAAEAKKQVTDAWQRAGDSPEPSRSALSTDVFAPDAAYLYQRPTGEPNRGQREISCSQALYEALVGEMKRDESVYLLGEDVTGGGYFAVTAGLGDDVGVGRVIDTPISEYAIVGSAVGAAMTGRRPIAEILFSDFITTCMDPLVNQAAKLRYMSGGQYELPLVVRTPGGAGLGMAAQHSQSLEAWLTGIAGLIVVAPATPYDAKGLLAASIRSNNPVVFFENKLLYALTGPVPEGDYIVPIGVADIKRSGTDVTIVSVGAALGKALDAATQLAGEGVSVEIVDVRTLVPLDLATILDSVCKTGRLVTVEDASVGHGFGSEVVARVAEVAMGALRAPPKRVGAMDIPIPYNSALENMALPDAASVCDAVRAVMAAAPIGGPLQWLPRLPVPRVRPR